MPEGTQEEWVSIGDYALWKSMMLAYDVHV